MNGSALVSFTHSYYMPHAWIGTVLCLLGIVTNVFNVVILTRPAMVSSVNIILTSVAICDAGLMALTFIQLINQRLLGSLCNDAVGPLPSGPLLVPLFNSVVELVWNQFSVWAHAASLWLAVFLAVARYFTIRSPRPVIWTQLKFTIQACVLLCVFCFVISVPAFLMYTVKVHSTPRRIADDRAQLCNYRFECNGDMPESACPATEHCVTLSAKCYPQFFVENHEVLLQLMLLTVGILHKIAPCILLTVFMSLLVRKLIEADRRHRRLVGGSVNQHAIPVQSNALSVLMSCFPCSAAAPRSDAPVPRRPSEVRGRLATAEAAAGQSDRTTTMLVLVVLIFIVCELPQGVTLVGVASDMAYWGPIYTGLGDVFDLLSLCNSSVNFILYCTMSQKYRDVFCEVFCRRLQFRETDTRVTTVTSAATNGRLLKGVEVNGTSLHSSLPLAESKPLLTVASVTGKCSPSSSVPLDDPSVFVDGSQTLDGSTRSKEKEDLL